VITFEKPFFVRAYVQETQLEWPILRDESRALYRAYGMERGAAGDIFGLKSWWTYLKLVLRGRRLRKSGGDVYQLGGDVLVDPEGIVRLQHIGRGPADRPPVDAILRIVTPGKPTDSP
jgi:alkyl hydroperoxide reductase subunit AhpC